ncbi:cytochrome p450 monooxygenase [Whalleya microplaca]|nr:cytochrome p450 monooxygenase [Whalleya microplaca]
MSLLAISSTGLILSAVATLILFIIYSHLARQGPPHPLPPGPPGRFLIGNAGQLSIDQPELDYIRWGKEYNSDVIYTNVLRQHMVCLNSIQAATDLLDYRSANYCDRPQFTLFEIMGWGLTLTFLRWGPQFKIHRRLFQNAFTQSNVKTLQPMQLHEARKAVRALVKDPKDWEDITLLMATSVIFRVACGQEIIDKTSSYCTIAKAATDVTTNGGIAGSTLVDVFPLARFLPYWINPSAPLRHALASRPTIQTVHNVLWNANLEDIEAGTAAPSFMKTHLDKYRINEKTRQLQDVTLADIKGAVAAIFIAGGNTTWATVLSCLLFLTRYPDAQKKVQTEIDAFVTSQGRLPTFEDRERLQALANFIMETMRCLPLNPLIIPHRSLRDDVYNGLFIPAGTTVFANTTAINSDPRTYRNPEMFDPDRYSTDRGSGKPEPYPSGNFGFGRRKCPGNHLALGSVWISISFSPADFSGLSRRPDAFLATLLAVFEVRMVRDEEGNPKVPVPGISVGLGGHPNPFECELVVRNEDMAKLLIEEIKE